MFNFYPSFCLSELKVGAVNHFNITVLHSISLFALNFTFLHSISLFCTDLGLIDMLLTNQNAEIVACILLVKEPLDSALVGSSCVELLHLKKKEWMYYWPLAWVLLCYFFLRWPTKAVALRVRLFHGSHLKTGYFCER